MKITKIKTLGVTLAVMLGTIAIMDPSVQAQDNVQAFSPKTKNLIREHAECLGSDRDHTVVERANECIQIAEQSKRERKGEDWPDEITAKIEQLRRDLVTRIVELNALAKAPENDLFRCIDGVKKIVVCQKAIIEFDDKLKALGYPPKTRESLIMTEQDRKDKNIVNYLNSNVLVDPYNDLISDSGRSEMEKRLWEMFLHYFCD
ncbi:MAG: hypothetical protein LBF56_01525 [Holosporales bacterium]|nr:hypothetical protein [Holosporales bacterium]